MKGDIYGGRLLCYNDFEQEQEGPMDAGAVKGGPV
jgi:hypothetical protein